MTRRALLAALLLSLAGCGDDHEHEQHGEEHDPAAEICEHMEEGPSVSVTAAAPDVEIDIDDVPAVAGDHRRHDINLAGDAAPFEGLVRFEVPEAGGYLLGFDAVLERLAVTRGAGEPDVLASGGAIQACSQAVPALYDADLEVGTYLLRITAAQPTVRLVIEEEAHEHE